MTESGSLHIKRRAESVCSPEMKKDRTENFPRIAAAIRILQPVTLLLDGEVVVFDKKRVFQIPTAPAG